MPELRPGDLVMGFAPGLSWLYLDKLRSGILLTEVTSAGDTSRWWKILRDDGIIVRDNVRYFTLVRANAHPDKVG